MTQPRHSVSGFLPVFRKKFASFCKGLPLKVYFIATPAEVFLYKVTDLEDQPDLICSHRFDHMKSVEENIAVVRDEVYPYLPTISQLIETSRDYETSEIEDIMEQGDIDVETLVEMEVITVDTVSWRIERVVLTRDELYLRNLNTGEVWIYKTKSPVAMVLRHLETLTPALQFEYFTRKTKPPRLYIDYTEDRTELGDQTGCDGEEAGNE